MKHILRISISVTLISLASCTPLQYTIPTTVQITQALEVTSTPLLPTDTPQLTDLPSYRSQPLAANGPWGVVKTDNGIWAFNPDGEGLRQLTQDKIIGDLAISPSGGKVAYLADTNPDDPNLEKISLRLLSLPDGTIQTISDVMPSLASMVIPTPESASGSPTPDLGVVRGNTYSALSSGDWSPDGQRLAFVSGHDGLFTNVYVYDLRTGKITRMTDRPHYEYRVKWSPTGEYIFFAEVYNFGGAGVSGGSAWVMRADHPESAPVWGIPASDNTPGVGIINWISPDTLLLEFTEQPCGIDQLSHVDVVTGKTQTLWQAAQSGDCIEHVMRDPVSGEMLLSQAMNNQPLTELHIVLFASKGVKLKDVNTGDLRTYLFRGSYPDNLNLVGSAAAVSASLPETLIPIQSPDGNLWAWLPWPTWPLTKGFGLWIGNRGQSPRQISSATVESFSWSPDGKTIFFYASGSLYIARWPDFKLEVLDAVLTPTTYYPYYLNVNWVIH